MYDELYAAWRLEIENGELGSLPTDFYARATDYLRRINEENKMIEKKSLKTTLLEHELKNAQRMVQELISGRYKKMLKMILAGRKVAVESLAAEEVQLYGGVSPSAGAYAKFVEGILQGKIVKIDIEVSPQTPEVVHTRVTLRFLKLVPSIIGSDMKTYGPFLVEDVASVPAENGKILVKQGLAKVVEIQ